MFRKFSTNFLNHVVNQLRIQRNKLPLIIKGYQQLQLIAARQDYVRRGIAVGLSLVYASAMTEQSTSQLISGSDDLYDARKFKESCDILESLKDTNDPEVLWRLSRGLYYMTKENSLSAADNQSLIKQADELLKKAMELNDKNYAVHKWTAIILNATTTLEGTKAKISSLPTFKYHIERAIELNPQDATSIHMLGSYFYSIADLAWYQKKICSALFGQVPEASFDEALSAFIRAEETKPNFYSGNLLMLGKTYMKLGKMDLAKHWLQRAANFSAKIHEDIEVTREAADLLKKMKA